jgi:ketosteroid isomerase-like protein
MRTNRVVVLILLSIISVQGQTAAEKTAGELRAFETTWLTAALNGDQDWLSRFASGKSKVLPPAATDLSAREASIARLVDTNLKPNEMKVRIAGTIMLLSSDPERNRSFNFLDTFNKTGGKWRIIASSISPATANPDTSVLGPVEQELLRLENGWAQVDVTNDRSIFDEIISPDFVETSISGKVRNRQEWLADWEFEGVKSAVNSEMQVRVLNDGLAVVTGVDNTVKLDREGKTVTHADRFTDTWSKNSSGQWQCVAAHVSRVR